MAAHLVASEPTQNSERGTVSDLNDMEKHLSSMGEPAFGCSSFNQEAPLCWSCFLPIFGNRPDMFDGDLLLDSGEDSGVSRCRNIRDGSTQTCDLPSECEYECMQGFVTQNLITSETDCTDSPLITGLSPISRPGDLVRSEPTADAMSFLSDWKIEETPDLDFSVATEDDESPVSCGESQGLDKLDNSNQCTSDIYKSNIVGGMEVRIILQQGDMEIPFFARIQFPCANKAWYKGLESAPLSLGPAVNVLGRIKVGGQTLSFSSRSTVES